jgi:hypothetical protein
MADNNQANTLPVAMDKSQARDTGKHTAVGLTPKTFEEALLFAKMIAGSDLAPKDYKEKPANVLVAIQMGAELGLAPMAALQNIAVINGRPSVWGDAALGIVMSHPAYEWHKEKIEGTGDDRVAVCTIKRRDHDEYTVQFSVTDAKRAGLWTKDGPWKTYPERMLQMRARGFALRDKFPDALRGLGIAEEVQDIPHGTIVDIATELPSEIKRKSETEPDPKNQPAAHSPSAPSTSSEPPADPAPSSSQEQPAPASDPLAEAREKQAELDRRRKEEGIPEGGTKPEQMSHVSEGLPLSFADHKPQPPNDRRRR